MFKVRTDGIWFRPNISRTQLGFSSVIQIHHHFDTNSTHNRFSHIWASKLFCKTHEWFYNCFDKPQRCVPLYLRGCQMRWYSSLCWFCCIVNAISMSSPSKWMIGYSKSSAWNSNKSFNHFQIFSPLNTIVSPLFR
jgi:hypothetical protein